MHSPDRPSNRLARETSPYLLQHAHNPVDWYPWGDEAFARSRAEDKPLLLSVGYSACHWCHVMERESFEDAETAEIMNRFFVSMKVDREERPDVDALYMQAVQAMTGQGGWPMTVFLMPDGRPFWGGTYFPPADRQGMPSFRRVLLTLAQAWHDQRGELLKSAGRVGDYVAQSMAATPGSAVPDASVLDAAAQTIIGQFDSQFGGFGRAPKFPQPMAMEFLLRTWQRTGSAEALEVAERTLQAMANGGMYDHLGGGFHRYSTDPRWLVPHFEKMLYDNALLARAYLQGYQATGNAFYRRICQETLTYLLRDMADPSGVFYSTEDADSEGEEGKFYVWTPAQVEAVLGAEDAGLVCAYWNMSERGNFERGQSILHVSTPLPEAAARLSVGEDRLRKVVLSARQKLFQARESRVRPGRDDKVLTSWNGLALRALAEAAATLQDPRWLDAAARCASALLRTVQPSPSRLLHTWKPGHAASVEGYLEDYANLADGLVALYEASFDPLWLAAAATLADAMVARFFDPESGSFFDTSADHEHLIARPRDLFDNATPSGSSVAADVLLRLALHLDRSDYRDVAESALAQVGELVGQYPLGFARALSALDFALDRPREIAIIGDLGAPETRSLLEVVFGDFLPNKVVEGTAPAGALDGADLPLLRDRPVIGGRATAYVCEGYVCQVPTTSAEELRAQINAR